MSSASIERKLENSVVRWSTSRTGAVGAGLGRDASGAATSLGGVHASTCVSPRSGSSGVSSGGSTMGPDSGAGSLRRRRGMPADVVPSVSASRSTGTAAGASGSTAGAAADAIGIAAVVGW
ncbi:hypothetical protein L600_004900000080 [Isoptericola variabilis J7]|nr:hypothetical protein L600_004900000080 [Isoptericola variabilis J7]